MQAETIAEMFRVLLLFRAIGPAEIVAWADERVLAEDEPAEWTMDLAAAGDDAESVYEALLNSPRASDAKVVLAAVLPRISRAVEAGALSAREAADALEALAIDEYAPEEVRGEFYYFADAYRAADEGYGTGEELDAKVLAYLRTGGAPHAV